MSETHVNVSTTFGFDPQGALRSRSLAAHLVEILLGPLVAVTCLIASVLIFGQSFDRQYFALVLITFLLLFPGILRLSENRTRMMIKATCAWGMVCLTLWLFGFATGFLGYFDLRVIALWQLGTWGVLLLAHEIARRIMLRVLSTKHYSAVIVGCNDTGLMLGRQVLADRYSGIKLLGFFDDRQLERNPSVECDSPLLGDMSELADYTRKHRVDHIYLALPMAPQPRILALLDELKDTTASVYFVPDIFVTDLIQGRVAHIAGMPVVAVCDTPFSGLRGLVKYSEDLILGTLILLLISPVLLAVAIGVRLSSPGPIIFKQRRYGLDGKEVLVYKFRSMTVTEDGDKSYTQVTKTDPRVTRFGAFIRKTSLDELPQFINVLQGRMSIVGPRPHAIAVNENYRKLIPGYMLRHKVRPGITGWAQVNGYRGGDDLEHMTKRVQYDLDYLRHWSLSLDIKIILRTVGLVAKDSSAY
ncbi:undecaprenyl-phosphate glucose phosphotransferase [Uliginosibacterium sediminicola]|uniref:Undecaprenyl-phosphate glucose phosphotransferase n=1 Tax=Uliginosibacterium sediminicola TaxID=2024550 RepID=A0ABU9Z084_9RHOO